VKSVVNPPEFPLSNLLQIPDINPMVEQNKQTAVAFYDLMFNQCKPEEAMDLYAGSATFSIIRMWVMAGKPLLIISTKWRLNIPERRLNLSG
jgi:hypothetical protein